MIVPATAFFSCATCGIEVTEFLTQMPERLMRLEAQSSALPVGYFIRLSSSWTYRDFISGRQGGHNYLSADGDLVAFEAHDYLLNISDVRHLVSADAVHGCCGLQPRDELNATCPSGHPIGTIHSDCWAASIFRLAHDHVNVIVA